MDVASPLARGRTAQVFALDERRVLRRYDGGEDATDEAAVMAYVSAHGYPVPAVESTSGPDIVMERIDGPTMLELLLEGRLEPAVAGVTLGELLIRLHALPPRPGCPSSERTVHLDLHPGNVLLSSRGPVVIDWCNARSGLPDLDIAVSALILAEVIASGHLAAAGAREMLVCLLATAGGRPEDQLAGAARMRAGDPHLEPGEIALHGRAASIVRAALP